MEHTQVVLIVVAAIVVLIAISIPLLFRRVVATNEVHIVHSQAGFTA